MNLAAWLQSLGLGRNERQFRSNEIDWGVLPKLTLEDRNQPWLALFTVCSVALGLRLFAIGRYGFDVEEIFSLRAASGTWHHLLLATINQKFHPPLFYTLLKLWLILIPANESSVRLLSVLLGTALVPVAFAICRKLRLAETDILLVTLLVAVNGELIYYAQHARMFPLFQLTSALSALAFVYFFAGRSCGRLIVLLCAANLLMVYSHYWGWLAIAAQFVCLLISRRAKVGPFVWSSVVVAILFAPWALSVTAAALDQGGPMRQIAWMGTDSAGSSDYAVLLGELNGEIDFKHATSVSIILFLTPIVVLFLRQLRHDARTLFEVRGTGFWGLLVAVPLVLTSFASYLAQQSFWGTRHLSLVAIPYFVLVGLSMTEFSPSTAKTALRCMILGWAVTAGVFSLTETTKDTHWEEVSKGIVLNDPVPVYVTEPFVKIPLEYYLEHSAVTAIAVNEQSDLGKIADKRFWFVYRDIGWAGPPPEVQFAAKGDHVERRFTVRSERRGRERQTITALLVRVD